MKLAIVGLGKMGGSILEGVLDSGLLAPDEVGVLDVTPEETAKKAARYGVLALSPSELARAERVLVAVKPQDFPRVARTSAHANTGYLSIMAGVSTKALSKRLGTRRVVRAMPNLAATIKRSTTVLTALPEAREAGDLEFAERLFATVGTVYHLPEELFDAFTAMSASAPAYLAVAAEALADGGVKMGIPREKAMKFAAEVLVATGLLLEKKHPAELKDEVASPGGTTIYGLAAMEARAFRAALVEAVAAATQRGKELGEE